MGWKVGKRDITDVLGGNDEKLGRTERQTCNLCNDVGNDLNSLFSLGQSKSI